MHGSINPVSEPVFFYNVSVQTTVFCAQGNILVPEEGTARICDFEIARIAANPAVTGQCTVATCRKGVTRYMAPEQVKPKSLGMSSGEAVKESDVYSFAMTTYKVCPFSLEPMKIPSLLIVGPHWD